MKALERDTKLRLSNNPTGELIKVIGLKMPLLWRFGSIKRKQITTKIRF
jgi:hypothetical protein